MKTALVIEDNEDNMVLITRLLSKHGYNAIAAICGREGVQKAIGLKPDFVLLDIQLPDFNGTEVLRQIRDSGSHVPIIAITSYAMAGDRERLLAAGCNGYIEKPIDPELVISQINQVLEETA